MSRIMVKIQNDLIKRHSLQREVNRNLSSWRALGGIWKGKKIINPVQWQKKTRREFERKSA